MKPIAVSMGEPAGIGPEIILAAWRAREEQNLPPFFVCGDDRLFRELGLPFGINVKLMQSPNDVGSDPHTLFVGNTWLRGQVEPGHPSRGDAGAVLSVLECAVDYCREGSASALVTAPIQKSTLYDAGFKYPGHTEYLEAKFAGEKIAPESLMLLVGGGLRVALVTIHVPLKDVAPLITQTAIVRKCQILAKGLTQDFGIAHPRIAVAALNPHGGEDGALGREEIDVIAPAVRALASKGIDARGPYPADTLFHEGARAKYDAVLCMYHDQDAGLLRRRECNAWSSHRAHIARPRHRARHRRQRHREPAELHRRAQARCRNRRAARTISLPSLWERIKGRDLSVRKGSPPPPPSHGEGDILLPPLREVIARLGLSAKKSLGQNFLLDLNLTGRIARAAEPAGKTILEVGPGPGGLTRALLAEGAARVIAIERDERCLPALEEIAAAYPGRLEIVSADALSTDESALLGGERVEVVANLPYNVGTALLIKWLRAEPWPPWFTRLTLLFQREVAERFIAAPDTDSYGRLSILAQWRSNPRLLFDISPRAFTPVPKVTSSLVQFDVLPAPRFPADTDALERVVAAGFGQRRKMLRQSLKSLGVPPEPLLQAAGIEGTARAETVTLEGFCALARAYAATPP
jgi:16S rRNA (adenine1518-N6/adenine1519-N6)-dimethyltransferase